MNETDFRTLQVRPKDHQLIAEISARRRLRKQPNHRIVDVATEVIAEGAKVVKARDKK